MANATELQQNISYVSVKASELSILATTCIDMWDAISNHGSIINKW